ncbi:MAG TPA: Fe-S oxidoreductase [Cytophagales bacterium]|nr:Fe-S oxidoreductase [Cytophagales bacterium]
MISQLLFIACLGICAYFLTKNIRNIIRNILLGKPKEMDGAKWDRWKMVLLIAFGQKKMFARPISALLHLCVYVGFVIINIEVLEIVTDGLLGTHRILYPVLGSFYSIVINFFEMLAILVILACVIFLLRRNVLKLPRFTMSEIRQFPLLDANLILIVEIVLMFAFLNMNATDYLLQSRNVEHYASTGPFIFSHFFSPLFEGLSTSQLVFAERFFWWAHIIGIMLFANYLPFSKHLHIAMAFPNTYYSNLEAKGKLKNMPIVTREVKTMLGVPLDEVEKKQAESNEIGRFGAKDVTDLTWKNLMEAYTCTECGRCSSVCPANITGKKLSPRKIMMDTRDRMEEIGRNIDKNGHFLEDGKSLFGNYISSEELLACTTCNACAEACPVNIDPLDIIVQLRRYRVMEEAKAPDSWNAMFANLENNQAPWKFSPSDRFNWANQ